MRNTLSNFNSIGEAIGYSQFSTIIKETQDAVKEATSQTKDRNQKAKISQIAKSSNAKFKQFLTDQGLRLDDEMIKHISR